MSSIEEYIAKLGCSDEAARIDAVEDIGYVNTPDGVPVLLDHLRKEPSRTVRNSIFQALIRIDGDAAIEGCLRLFGSEDPQTRNQAVDVLRHKGQRAIPFLNLAMRDGDKDIRKLVLDTLSGTQAQGAGAISAVGLSDEDPNVVITAVENLGRIRAEEFRSRIEDLLREGSHPMLLVACVEALVSIGHPESLGAIRRRFPDLTTLPDFFVPSYLKAMAAHGSQTEFDELVNLLKTRGRNLRPAILGAILAMCSRCQSPETGENLLPVLRAIVENGDPPLCRYQAIKAMGYWADRDEVSAYLLLCLKNPERLVRLGAVESLRITNQSGMEVVLAARALEETDDEVRQALSCGEECHARDLS
ncbi:HEAT repeat domain-containing protein [Paludibaculum fermentans]|uniref:HEAT repeat domain-containing protein n=1 Tax=Paludibaculum fermentans TaxID=1473598 RepID=UPI003EBA0A08